MDPSKLGMNRTGVQMSPLLAREQREVPDDLSQGGDSEWPAAPEVRKPLLEAAKPVGSMPPPGTLKGATETVLKLVGGERLNVLLDKLGERLAFERGGTRLYDAFIEKCTMRLDEVGGIDVTLLQRFREEEAEHARLVAAAIVQVGGDPTVQTPCANVVGVSSMGLLQVVRDPRTSVAQSMQAVLTAELVDATSWELLQALVADFGFDDIAEAFARAAQEEAVHLEQIQLWYESATRATAGVAA